jgi:hypothetical protein
MLNLENLPPRLSRRDASEYLYIKHGIVRAAIKQPDVWKLGFVLISHPVFPILCMPC